MEDTDMPVYAPELLVQEVWELYGLEVDVNTAYNYADTDPLITPETLYMYVTGEAPPGTPQEPAPREKGPSLLSRLWKALRKS